MLIRPRLHRIARALACATLACVAAAPAVAQCQIAKLFNNAPSYSGDQFGYSVATSGLRTLIGSPWSDPNVQLNQGVAFAYRRVGAALVPDGVIIATGGGAGDHFGESVGLSGDVAIVGAPNARATDPNLLDGFGAAYIFRRNIDGQWVQEAALTAPDAARSDAYGCSVAISGDVAVVGARLDDHAGGTNAGSAYIYRRTTSGVWIQSAKVVSSTPSVNAYFGCAVAASGETVVVGAYSDAARGAASGAVYVFVPNGAGWTQQTRLLGADTATFDNLGVSVAIDGDTVAAGAWLNVSSGIQTGCAYVWKRTGTQWAQQARLAASDAVGGDWFGNAVAVGGDVVVVGTSRKQIGANGNQGAAYCYRRFGSAWTQEAKLTAPDGAPVDYYGFSAAISGNVAVVGARFADVNNVPDAGAAYVYAVGGPDCTGNGVPDLCDIAQGRATDADGNGVPDSCDPVYCPEDVNHDGRIDAADVGALLGYWGTNWAAADITRDGVVNSADLARLLGMPWGPCH